MSVTLNLTPFTFDGVPEDRTAGYGGTMQCRIRGSGDGNCQAAERCQE